MKRLSYLGSGIIPLLILILAEWMWGMKIGLLLAFVYGIGELWYKWIRYKKIDKNIYIEIGLILIVGIIILLVEDETLEYLKTLIYTFIFLVIVGISAFSKYDITAAMLQRMMKNRTYSPFEMYSMKRVMRSFFYALLAYTLLLLASIISMPVAITLSITTHGIYIALGVFFISTLIHSWYKNRRYAQEEWLPLLQEDGTIIGTAPRSVVHNKRTHWLHPVVHLHIVSSKGIWLQKRALHKQVQPGKWDTAVGGHVSAHESIQDALYKESWEELKVRLDGHTIFPLGTYVWKTSLEHELAYSFAIYTNKELHVTNDEISDVKLWTTQQIAEEKHTGIFTQNLLYELELYLEKLENIISNVNTNSNKI